MKKRRRMEWLGHNVGGKMSPTYRSWVSMLQRCENSNAPNYPSYGGAGITVFPLWQKFSAFLSDMGERPEGTTLDRFPNHRGNYEPGNCRWATRLEQQNNTSMCVWIDHDGRLKTLAQWSRHFGISYGLVKKRYAAGHRAPYLFRPVDLRFSRTKKAA